MSGQPQVEHLVKGFLWAQVDQVNKRLYYVCPEQGEDVSRTVRSVNALSIQSIVYSVKHSTSLCVAMSARF